MHGAAAMRGVGAMRSPMWLPRAAHRQVPAAHGRPTSFESRRRRAEPIDETDIVVEEAQRPAARAWLRE